jgi:RNA polymerase sigma-70 factor (ECF subfamily)
MTSKEQNRRFYDHVWPLRATVLRSARFLCDNAQDAEDLAQEALLKAFRAMASFDAAGHAQAWLMTILRNAHIDRLRAGARSARNVSLEGLGADLPARAGAAEHEPDVYDPHALLEELSDAQIIAGLRRLPADICWSLLLVDVQQMTYDDAAKILAVPPGTVKSRIHRGRRMLRDDLRQAGSVSISADGATADTGGRI